MSVLRLLANDDFIAVNRTVASVVGIDGAIMLGELASEYKYWDDRGELKDGMFYSTIENMEKNTYMSAYNQRIALAKLEEAGLITVTKMGMPAKRYIKIHEDKVLEVFNDKSLKILTTSDENNERQVVENFDTNNNRDKENTPKRIDKELEIDNKPVRQKRFRKPTVEEIESYCRERNNNVDANKFYDYYESKGWIIGKSPMKDWKACVRTWERNNYGSSYISNKSDNPFDNIE